MNHNTILSSRENKNSIAEDEKGKIVIQQIANGAWTMRMKRRGGVKQEAEASMRKNRGARCRKPVIAGPFHSEE